MSMEKMEKDDSGMSQTSVDKTITSPLHSPTSQFKTVSTNSNSSSCPVVLPQLSSLNDSLHVDTNPGELFTAISPTIDTDTASPFQQSSENDSKAGTSGSRHHANSTSRARASSLPLAPRLTPLRRYQTKAHLRSTTRAVASPITADHISQHLNGLSMSGNPAPATSSVTTAAVTNVSSTHSKLQSSVNFESAALSPKQEPSQLDFSYSTDGSSTSSRRESRTGKFPSRTSKTSIISDYREIDSEMSESDEDDESDNKNRRMCHNERERYRRKNLRHCYLRCQQVTPSIAADRNVADRVLLSETRNYVLKLQQDHIDLCKTITELEFELLVSKTAHPELFGDDRTEMEKLAEHLAHLQSRNGAALLLQAMDQFEGSGDTVANLQQDDQSINGTDVLEHSQNGKVGRSRRKGPVFSRRQRQNTV